jgi:hypothetical protein
MQELAAKVRKRAARALVEARFYLAAALLTGIGMVYYFTTFGGGIWAKGGRLPQEH